MPEKANDPPVIDGDFINSRNEMAGGTLNDATLAWNKIAAAARRKTSTDNVVKKRRGNEQLKENGIVVPASSEALIMKGSLPSGTALTVERGKCTDDFSESGSTGTVEGQQTALPCDVYSLLFFAQPWGTTFFLVVFVFLFQIGIMTLIMLDMLDYPEGFPILNPAPGISATVRTSQFFALVVAVVTQDDVVLSLNIGLNNALLKSALASERQCLFSCLCRFVEGGVGMVISFLIIIQSREVIDLFKDFAAMAFVSSIDNVSFFLALRGYFTESLRKQALHVMELKLPNAGQKSFALRRVLLLLIFVAMTAGWICVALPQSRGDYLCRSISVHVTDQYRLGDSFHSGMYEWEGDIVAGRAVYVESKVSALEEGREGWQGRFGFCHRYQSWTFAFVNNAKPDYDPCRFTMRSLRTDKFNLVGVNPSEWFYGTGSPAAFPIFSCNQCVSDMECNFNGKCNVNTKRCDCNSDRFGTWCEHPKPCPTLVADVRKSFPFWAEHYEILVDGDNYVLVYERPVYVHTFNERSYAEIIMFTGARWIVTSTDLLDVSPNKLKDYLSSFHAGFHYWDAAFISEPTFGVTPRGLQWYEWISGAGADSVGTLEEIDASLLCSVCDDFSNICGEAGFCQNGSCVCSYGYFGALCQTPPVKGAVTLMLDHFGRFCSTCGQDSFQTYLPIEEDGVGLSCVPYPWVPLYLGSSSTSRGIAFGLNATHFLIYLTKNDRVYQRDEGGKHACDENSLLLFVHRDPRGSQTHTEKVVELSAELNQAITKREYAFSCPSKVDINSDLCATPEGFALYIKENVQEVTRAWIHIAVDVAGQESPSVG